MVLALHQELVYSMASPGREAAPILVVCSARPHSIGTIFHTQLLVITLIQSGQEQLWWLRWPELAWAWLWGQVGVEVCWEWMLWFLSVPGGLQGQEGWNNITAILRERPGRPLFLRYGAVSWYCLLSKGK